MNHFKFQKSKQAWQQTSVSSRKNLQLKGNLYLDNKLIDITTFANILLAADNTVALNELLLRMNGFYAWIEETPEGVRAAVDHIRSYPLFYALKNGDFFLSDDAEWVRQQVGDEVMDPIAREEFLLAGYVTGKDTLYPQVKQLQAGEYLDARASSSGINVITGRYYRFWHKEPTEYQESQLREKLEQVTLNAMRRLVEQAAGRQIVIPLSGGYDSRLIASMLKKLNYGNVVCFTYGVPGNREAEYSKKVALALGFKWLFVEYSSDMWREVWRSPKADEYRKIAANHTSLPHVQDWLAIKKLLDGKLIDVNALLVPGHSGDFVAGSHIPDFVFSKKVHSQKDLVKSLAKNHLSNAPKSGTPFENRNFLNSRLMDRISAEFDGTAAGLANLYEMWDWQERQAKYIVNSVRVYDQYKLQWWIPLWDLEFVQFWENVPLSLRKHRSWFKQWISEKFSEHATNNDSRSILNNASDPSWPIAKLTKISTSLPEPIKNILKKFIKRSPSTNHFLGFDGLTQKNSNNKYSPDKYNIIGIYSDLYIKDEWGK